MRRLTLLLVMLLVAVAAMAVEVTMSDEEQAICAQQGGCEFVSVGWLKQAMKESFEKGKAAGRKSCLNELT